MTGLTIINYKTTSYKLIALCLCINMVGCSQNLSIKDSEHRCAQNPSAGCFLSSANDRLARMPKGSDWLLAALELAGAWGEVGSRTQAEQLFQETENYLHRQRNPSELLSGRTFLATAYLSTGNKTKAEKVARDALKVSNQVENLGKRWDGFAKAAVLLAEAGFSSDAFGVILSMPETDDTLASYKARGLHELARVQAAANDFDGAVVTLDSMTMGLTYYSAVAHAYVAEIAQSAGRGQLATQLIEKAQVIGSSQNDGYFIAGALRRVGSVYAKWGQLAQAELLYELALGGARQVPAPQRKARAISRIATAMADFNLYAQAMTLIPEAVDVAQVEPSDSLRHWTHYEIAGSAAFSGDFGQAKRLLSRIPMDVDFSGANLLAATKRDVAWGYAKHADYKNALDLALSIHSGRAQVQALTRIARIINNPQMKALPRYL